jgi:hypothetical protein
VDRSRDEPAAEEQGVNTDDTGRQDQSEDR